MISNTLKNKWSGFLTYLRSFIQYPEYRPESVMLILAVFIYVVLGIALSASPLFFSKPDSISTITNQSIYMAIGFLIFLLFPFIRLETLIDRKVFLWFTLFVIFMQIMPPIAGQTLNGASRWFLHFQVSDILAFYLVFYAVFVCSDNDISVKCTTMLGFFQYILLPIGIVAVLVAIWQNNASTAALLCVSTGIILWLGGKFDNKKIILMIVLALIASVCVFSKPYRLARISNWWTYDCRTMSPILNEDNGKSNNDGTTNENLSSQNMSQADYEQYNAEKSNAEKLYSKSANKRKKYLPNDWDEKFRAYAFGDGMQAFYSKLSVLSVGFDKPYTRLVGFFPGRGRVNASGRLPISESDYIFSVLCEEWGFLGILIFLLTTSCFLIKALHSRASPDDVIIGDGGYNPDPQLHLFAVGVVVMITMQAVYHIFVNLSLFPVTGIPLPLFSNGGTSRIIILAMLGILLNTTCNSQATVVNFVEFVEKYKILIFIFLIIAVVVAIAVLYQKISNFYSLPCVV